MESHSLFNPYSLLEPKGICLSHQYRARPVCTSVLPDQLQVLILISVYMIMVVPKIEGGLFNLRNSEG